MKREEAIYCLKAQSERYSEVCEECPLYGQTGVDHCCEDALQLAITALQNQPVWISVSERLPEKEGRYLVTFRSERKAYLVGYGNCRMSVDGKKIGYGWYDLHYAIYFDKKSIIAWMPLPEPYRESEVENGEV